MKKNYMKRFSFRLGAVAVLIAVACVCAASAVVTGDVATDDETCNLGDAARSVHEFESLVEKARWGDRQAFLRLAECYRDGIGTERHFGAMTLMVEMATLYGAIDNERVFFDAIPQGCEYKTFIDILNMGAGVREVSDSIMCLLTLIGGNDAMAVRGIVMAECGDTVQGMSLIRQAVDEGSDVADIIWLVSCSGRRDEMPDATVLLKMAERFPGVYSLLAVMCLEPDDDGNIDEPRAADYCLKAERRAMLGNRQKRWLLSYNEKKGNALLTDEDVRRIETSLLRAEVGAGDDATGDADAE